ncbi:MAG: glutaredoxin domain-containing protein [Actinomycetota bacterium]|nr:glutaredoxin domain-containing protein [Actinomycetota bacterium]
MAIVKLYSTPTCPYCKMAKDFLGKEGVAFDDIDITSDGNAAREMVDKSGQMGIPVLEVDNTIIVGFDRGAYKKALVDAGASS